MDDRDGLHLYTLQEVADLLRLPYAHVRDRVYSGAWPHMKFSARNRRMSQEQIDSVVAEAAHAPQTHSLSDAHQRRKLVHGYLRARP